MEQKKLADLCWAKILTAILILFFCAELRTAVAEGVPQNLASMAKDLFIQTRAQLKQPTGDPKRDAMNSRARQILKQAGIRYWAQEEVRMAKSQDLPRNHNMMVGDSDDQLDINWNPDSSNFEIRIKANETSKGTGDGFLLQLNGEVLSTLVAGGSGTVLSILPGTTAVTVLTAEELLHLQGEIFGKWSDGDGNTWEISSKDSNEKVEQPSEYSEERIAELHNKIERIRSDKVFRWKNFETGEVVLQKKFKRLKEPFDYEGKLLYHPDGEAEIARLKKQIKELRAANKPLPVVTNDPIGINKVRASGRAQSLNIQVTDKNGYTWTYDEVMLLDGRITASRTLNSLKDSPRLPEKVMRQAIASRSSPEWVALDVIVESDTREVYMSGQFWRMKVTYSGDDFIIKRIHTPWFRNLRLERKTKQTDELELKLVRITPDGIEEVGENIEFYGGPFYLEAIYKKPQNSLIKSIKWEVFGRSGQSVSLFGESISVYPLVSNPKIFRSNEFYIFAESLTQNSVKFEEVSP